MYPAFLKLFFIFNLFILSEVTGNDVEITKFKDGHPYNIQKVFQKFYATINTKDKTAALAKYIFRKPLDLEFVLHQLENLSEKSKCLKDITYTFESLKNASENPWALSMLDSFAKPESGILQGNLFWTGEYNECIQVHAPTKESDSTTGNFHGQYCTLSYNLTLFNETLPLKFAICLPDSCSPNDLQNEILLLLHEAGGFHVSDKESFFKMSPITCSPLKRQLNAPAISVIVLLSVFCSFALAGSSVTAGRYFKKFLEENKRSSLVINIYDKDISNQDIPNKCVKSDDACLINNESSNKGFSKSFDEFLNCFCIFTNGAKLLNTDSSEGQLMCIHGIRFLSMSWVILGHSYIFNFMQLRNKGVLLNILDDFNFQVILQGTHSVDSFFVLSGFLLTYLSMKEFSKSKGSINWPYFYIHRYIRLTPIYMIVLGFFATVHLYLGSGPYWPVWDTDPGCIKTWWWNLLYINNFVDETGECMGWSWYLANDMQFFVISPIFLITLWRWPKIGYSLLGLFLVACMLSNFFITYHFDMLIGFVGLGGDVNVDQFMTKVVDYFNKIYFKPYTRIGPYLVGIIAGYVLFKHKTSKRPKLNLINLSIGWIVATAVTLTCVYGVYHHYPSLVARSIYNAVHRICFGAGLSWVIYVCLTNQSEIVNRILSYKLFIPLSRLTYSAYLIHPMILNGYYANMKRPMVFSHPLTVLLFLGFMVVTYALALPVSLILESPIMSMEKLIRNKFTKKQTESAS